MAIFLARHAECQKNLSSIAGGPGSALTPQGLQQAMGLGVAIATQHGEVSSVHACPVPQAIETARCVSARTGIPFIAAEQLRPIFLGVLDGLSIEQARIDHPRSSLAMEGWRAGAVQLSDLKIGGMEDAAHFYMRGVNYLLEEVYGSPDDVVLAICTSSIMILLSNILGRRSAFEDGRYLASEFDNAELRSFELSLDHQNWLMAERDRYARR